MAKGNTVTSYEQMQDNSNRLRFHASHYHPTPFNITFPVSLYTTIDELIKGLRALDRCGIHLVGTQGHCYHSEAMARTLETLSTINGLEYTHPGAFRLLTRTGGLRETAIMLLLPEGEKREQILCQAIGPIQERFNTTESTIPSEEEADDAAAKP